MYSVSRFFGFEMQQRVLTVEAFSILFSSTAAEGTLFSRIVELGTGLGGLAVFLGLYAARNDCEMHTIDIEDSTSPKTLDVLRSLGVKSWYGDVLSDDRMINMIKSLISSDGASLLLCDDGNKVKEFNLYAPSLKVGDVIMAHDYMETYERFKDEYEGKIWDSCEITYSDIHGVCSACHLEPFMQDVFDPFAWVCMRKI